MPDSVLRDVLHLFRDNSEISFLAAIKQEVGDSGSIISLATDMIR